MNKHPLLSQGTLHAARAATLDLAELLDTDPQRMSIASAFCAALRDFAGSWNVSVVINKSDDRWIVLVQREEDGIGDMFLVDPLARTSWEVAAFVADSLANEGLRGQELSVVSDPGLSQEEMPTKKGRETGS